PIPQRTAAIIRHVTVPAMAPCVAEPRSMYASRVFLVRDECAAIDGLIEAVKRANAASLKANLNVDYDKFMDLYAALTGLRGYYETHASAFHVNKLISHYDLVSLVRWFERQKFDTSPGKTKFSRSLSAFLMKLAKRSLAVQRAAQ